MKSIEFIGLPGAGKTTVLEKCITSRTEVKVIDHLCAAKKRLKRPYYLYIVVILLVLIRRRVRGVWYMIRSQAGRRLLAKLSIRLKGYRQCASEMSGEVILVDSGFIMPFLTGVIEDGFIWRRVDISSFLESLPPPSKVVLVDVARSMAFERFDLREKENHEIRCVTEQSYTEAESLLHVINRCLKKNKIKVVEVDNSIDFNCDEMLEFLK